MKKKEREVEKEEKVKKSKAIAETPKSLLLTPPCVLSQLAFISAELDYPLHHPAIPMEKRRGCEGRWEIIHQSRGPIILDGRTEPAIRGGGPFKAETGNTNLHRNHGMLITLRRDEEITDCRKNRLVITSVS